MNEHWSYKFHGDACQFENNNTGQVVDVKINGEGNYGVITRFYLFKFINTTISLTNDYSYFKSEEQVNDVLNSLIEKRLIIDVGTKGLPTLVLNKSLR